MPAERLIDAVCSLDYPRDRLEIQVLDDAQRQGQVQEVLLQQPAVPHGPQIAGLEEVPVISQDFTDEEKIEMMVKTIGMSTISSIPTTTVPTVPMTAISTSSQASIGGMSNSTSRDG